MSARHLRTIIDQSSEPELQRWFDSMRIIARAKLNSAIKQYNIDYELPEAREIVAETVKRVLDGQIRYVWDGSGTFDAFFVRCLKRTIDGLRALPRRDAKRNVSLDSVMEILDESNASPACQYDAVLAAQYKQAAAGLLSSRVKGKRSLYIEKLPRFAAERLTTKEIAEILGVTEETVKEFRKRVRVDLKRRDGQ